MFIVKKKAEELNHLSPHSGTVLIRAPCSPFVAVLYFLFVKVQLGGSGLLSGKRVRRVGEREVQRLILRVGRLSPWKVPICKVW